ncbi:MAG: type II toxin-antitoxin system Phd/YefM family antitoxin [Acidobacteria bacterium]|nr:MAG: type II toxin-antitoxin system Phd/YefM family antitoxin [Acidobacteriota bacterium]
METIAVSEFKATCAAVVEKVRKTKQPVTITRFGQPVAQLVPPTDPAPRRNWLGCMAGTATILDDLIEPVGSEEDWEATRIPPFPAHRPAPTARSAKPRAKGSRRPAAAKS